STRIGRRRRDEADRAKSATEWFAIQFAALRIELQCKCGGGILTVRQRDVRSSDSFGRRLRPQHHAGAAPAGATERSRKLHVLKRLIENEPAAFSGLRGAHDLAILRAPIRIADGSCCPQRRSLEGPVGDK